MECRRGLNFPFLELRLLASFPYLCRPFTNSGCGDLLVNLKPRPFSRSIFQNKYSKGIPLGKKKNNYETYIPTSS